jgi:tRNA_anti-like
MNEWQEYARRLATLSPEEREAEMARLTPEQRQALEEAQRMAPPPPPPPIVPAAAPAPAKRKVWPWVVGCGCLLPLVVLALLFALGVKSIGGMDKLNQQVAEKRAAREAQDAVDRQAEEAAETAERQAKEFAKKAERQAAKASAISAVDMVSHYDANEIAADQAFKGKKVAVKGTVGNIAKDVTGTMYVTLEGPDDTFRDVQCFFADSDANVLASLSPGQRLIVQCRCDGLFMNVLLKECEVLE